MSIRMRLAASFASIGIILIIIVLLGAGSIQRIQMRMDRLVSERLPGSESLADFEIHVLATMSSLRGWMLTENPDFKYERAGAWAMLAEIVADAAVELPPVIIYTGRELGREEHAAMSFESVASRPRIYQMR